jgi:hypothetical protein
MSSIGVRQWNVPELNISAISKKIGIKQILAMEARGILGPNPHYSKPTRMADPHHTFDFLNVN